MNISSETFAAHLAIDVVAIGVLLYFIYYRRHRRRDLLMACISFNVALFLVVTVLAHGPTEVGVAAGIGLFGAVSLIRLRSEELSYIEVAYFFSALALALINGFGLDNQLTAHSAERHPARHGLRGGPGGARVTTYGESGWSWTRSTTTRRSCGPSSSGAWGGHRRASPCARSTSCARRLSSRRDTARGSAAADGGSPVALHPTSRSPPSRSDI